MILKSEEKIVITQLQKPICCRLRHFTAAYATSNMPARITHAMLYVICRYLKTAGSSRLYDSMDSATLMKSVAGHGTKTADSLGGTITDSTVIELSEALR